MEILTLQLGNYSNYVGTHFWNIQDAAVEDKELRQDNLFRLQHSDKSNVNYVPRLLLFDLKESMGTLNTLGNLNQFTSPVLWEGSVTSIEQVQPVKNSFLRGLDDAAEQYSYERQKKLGINNPSADPLQKKKNLLKIIQDKELKLVESLNSIKMGKSEDIHNINLKLSEIQQQKKNLEEDITRMEIRLKEIQGEMIDPKIKYNFNLDSTVSYWSDYLKVYYSDNSIIEYSDYVHNDSVRPFNMYTFGHNLFKNPDMQDEVESKLHKFLEECDHLQGFNILCDIDSGFGGITEDILIMLNEEYQRIPICLYGFYGPPKDKEKMVTSKRIINLGLSMARLSELSSIYVPLSYKHWRTNNHFPNLKLKMEKEYHTSSIFASAIDTISRPYRLNNSYSMRDFTQIVSNRDMNICTLELGMPIPIYHDQKLDTLLDIKNTKIYSAYWMNSLTPNTTRDSLISPYSSTVVMRGIPSSNFSSSYYYQTQSQLLSYFLSNFSCNYQESFAYDAPLSVPISFPQYFASNVTKNGILNPNLTNSEYVKSLPVMSHLQITPQQIYTIDFLCKACKEILVNIGLYTNYELNKSDFLGCVDRLEHMVDLYKK